MDGAFSLRPRDEDCNYIYIYRRIKRTACLYVSGTPCVEEDEAEEKTGGVLIPFFPLGRSLDRFGFSGGKEKKTRGRLMNREKIIAFCVCVRLYGGSIRGVDAAFL